MSATVWLVLVVIGFGLLRFVTPHTQHDLLKAVLARVAAMSFIGAGLIGGAGWLGGALHSVVGWVNTQGGSAMAATIGTGAMWILWAALSLVWVLTFLPDALFAKDMPDWLSVTGLVIPALAVSIPGGVGNFFQTINQALGGLMIHFASSVIGAA